jgi:two-component system, LytTR family, sensor kinase
MNQKPDLDSGAALTTPRQIAIVLLLWAIFGVLSALQIYVRDLSGNPQASVWQVFNIFYFYIAWAPTTPLILRLANRVATDSRQWPMRIVAAIPMAVAIMAIQSLIYAAFTALDDKTSITRIPSVAAESFLRHLAGSLLTIGTIVVADVAFRYYQTTQQRLVRAAEIEASLATARLDTLRAQMQPHFLFNTLNIISGLVAKGDASSAHRAIARLGDLLRASLEGSGEQTVPLEHELELTRRYLEIAQLRFGDRLTVHESVADDLLRAQVPTLILQPLIENALQHGISQRERGGTIWIEGERANGKLLLSVRDDGPGFRSGAATDTGLGLSNTRDRLSHLYGPSASLRTHGTPGTGATVTVELPFPS